MLDEIHEIERGAKLDNFEEWSSRFKYIIQNTEEKHVKYFANVSLSRSLLRNGFPLEAKETAEACISVDPRRHQGWRLAIECTSRLQGSAWAALALFLKADRNGHLDGRARRLAAGHVMRAMAQELSRDWKVSQPNPEKADELLGRIMEKDTLFGSAAEQHPADVANSLLNALKSSLNYLHPRQAASLGTNLAEHQLARHPRPQELFHQAFAAAVEILSSTGAPHGFYLLTGMLNAPVESSLLEDMTEQASNDFAMIHGRRGFLLRLRLTALAIRRELGERGRVFAQRLAGLLEAKSNRVSSFKLFNPFRQSKKPRKSNQIDKRVAASHAIDLKRINSLLDEARKFENESAARRALWQAAEMASLLAENHKVLARISEEFGRLRGENNLMRGPMLFQQEDFLRSAINREPMRGELKAKYIRQLIARKQLDKARALVDEMQETSPQAPHTHHAKTRIGLESLDLDGALEAALMQLHLTGDSDALAQNDLADVYEALGRLDLAVTHRRRSLALAPQNAGYRQSYTRNMISLGCTRSVPHSEMQKTLAGYDDPVVAEAGQPSEAGKVLFITVHELEDPRVPALDASSTGESLRRLLGGQLASDRVLLASGPVAAEQREALLQELRRPVGFTYGAPAGNHIANSRPDAMQASLLMVRIADLREVCDALRQASVGDVLGRLTATLRGQFVPMEIGELPRLLDDPREAAKPGVLTTEAGRSGLPPGLFGALAVEAAPAKEFRNAGLKAPHSMLIAHWRDLETLEDPRGLAAPFLLRLDGLSDEVRSSVAQSPVQLDRWRFILSLASGLLVTERDTAEWLEDSFRIGVSLSASPAEGLKRFLAFTKRRFLIGAGAGLGNVVQVTPLIRWLSDHLKAPVDVVIRSPAPIAHELFTCSPYINLVYHLDGLYGGRDYDDAHILTTFKAVRPIPAKRLFLQRSALNFYPSTLDKLESRHYFEGLERLLGEKVDVKNVTLRPFVRDLDKPREGAMEPRPIKGARIGICAKTDGVWSKREWPHYEQLAANLLDLGAELYSFGAPTEYVAGTLDHTGAPLRENIRDMYELDAFVTSDGGLFHIADALSLKTFELVGPTSVIKNGPMTDGVHVIMAHRACSPCQFKHDIVTCRLPQCMADISLECALNEIVEGIQSGAFRQAARQALMNAIRHEQQQRSLPIRPEFKQEFDSQSFSLYQYARPGFKTLFDAALKCRDVSRAKGILAWAMIQHPDSHETLLARAQLAFHERDLKATMAFCLDAERRGLKDCWPFRRLLLNALHQLRRWRDIAGLWSKWESDDGAPGSRAWAECAFTALFAFNALDRREEAASVLERVKQQVTTQKALECYRSRLDDRPYRVPWRRPQAMQSGRLKIAIVGDWSTRPEAVSRFSAEVEVYALRPSEMTADELSGFDLLLVTQGAFDATRAEVPDLEEIAVEEQEAGNWHVLRIRKEGNAPWPGSLAAWLRDQGVQRPDKEKAGRRILLVANHHLEKWSPRGGERSSAAILRYLKAQGYEAAVIVENKKNDEVGVDELGVAPHVLPGRDAFVWALEAMIVCWRPDLVAMYGLPSVIAQPVVSRAAVPFVMFPRDWQEICPPPHTKAIERARVFDQSDPYLRLYQAASRIVTNARYVGSVIQKLYGRVTVTAYVPVEPPVPSFKPRPLEERDQILLINAQKWGGGNLVREIAALRPDLRFHVIGGDGLVFADNVKVSPFFEAPDYWEMYRDARILLFPVAGEDPCGTGRVVFEALFTNTPVLSVDIGGMSEVLPSKWLLNDPRTEDWASALDRLLRESFSNQEFRTLCDRFNAQKQLAKLNRLMGEISRR